MIIGKLRPKQKVFAYLRTSSAANTGEDKDSDTRQLEAIKSRVTDEAFPRKSDDTSPGCVPTRAGHRLIGCSARWRDVRKGREVRRREDFTSAHEDRMSDQLSR
jgi:hypothetical protein